MARRRVCALLVAVLSVWAPLAGTPTAAGATDLTGDWRGNGEGVIFSMNLFQYGTDLYAEVYLPELGLLDAPMLGVVVGNDFVMGYPGILVFEGTLVGDSLAGELRVYIPFPPGVLVYEWQAFRYPGPPAVPGPAPGPSCDLPPLFCIASAQNCGELVQFDPILGPGYFDYPVNGETWGDQWRSYLRRDLRQIITYATAKVACKTVDWDYGSHGPLGLGDMSEADGAIPGTSTGHPDHLPGTHEDGKDIDTAYYQLYAQDNLLRPIGVHHEGLAEAYHLTAEPYALDPWRTALYIAYLSEHPRMRAIGVDGQAGPILEDALDDLVAMGWISSTLRASIPLAYEVTNQGRGWFYFHHHHLHVSLSPLHDIVSEVDLAPAVLNKRSRGKYITGYIELDAEYDPSNIYIASVALIVNGHTLVYAEPQRASVSDFNNNGVPDLTVKFDRKLVAAGAGTGTVEMAITGWVDGKFFQATDTIRILSR